MTKLVLSLSLVLHFFIPRTMAQSCEILAVNAVALPCTGSTFNVSIDLEVENPASPGFTLAGNGVIYGTYLYADLPVTIGPFVGDDESVYDFIAWDVENADCQNYVWLSAPNCGPICSISEFQLEFVTCVSNQSAIVVFDFEAQNPAGLTFDLYDWDGESLGTWLYESLPVTLPFFETNGAAPIVLTVCDHTNPSCCTTFELDAIDCNPNNCEIFNVTVDPQCTGSNFLAHLDFGYDQPASDSFTVTGNNLNYGTFGYNELPVALGPLNGSSNINWQFIVTDTENASCRDTFVLGIYQCPPPCQVLAVEALALECNGNEAFALEIGMDIEGEGDTGFAVFSDTYYYGSYNYDALPIIIPSFEVSGQFIDYVSVCDNENQSCCLTTPFEALICSGCLIYNLSATALPCNEMGQIMVEINFDYQNTSPEGFEVSGNGNNYGEFAYEDLPILLGPFAGDGSQYFEFVITDLGDDLCFEAVELGFIDCEDICELSELVTETGDCTGNNTYQLTLDFDFSGPVGATFDLTLNGDLYGTYAYADLPLTFEEFPGSGLDTIIICDNENPDCCIDRVFEAPNCECHIFDLTSDNLGCTSDSTVGYSLEFFYENLPGDFVDVFYNGEFIGFYNVSAIPITVHIPEGDGTGVISVCANDLGTCCDETLVELMNCESPECQISALFAETGDCNSDSTFLLDIVFDYSHLPTDSVEISANGHVIGTYLVHPDFIRIEHFPVFDEDTTTLTVCAQGDANCCATFSFATPDCSQFGQCHIWDLNVDVGDCTSDSTYILHVVFEFQNLPNDSVVITSGTYELQTHVHEGHIIIEHFPVSDEPLTTLVVCADGDPACCDTITYETPDCSQFGQCQIWDLVIDIIDCTSDSTFFAFINYNYENLPGDFIEVTANGNSLGTFPVQEPGFTIEDFPVYNEPVTVLTVCSTEDPECCETIEFETPDCEGGGSCHVFDLVADPGECTSDSTYILFIQYFGVNLPSDSVTVEANDILLGAFPHNPDGLTIFNFPAFLTNHTVITVCALNAPDCCDVFEFETPDCGQNSGCHIFDLIAETGACTSDSTYILDVVFESNNLPNDSVLIYANDVLVGQYFNEPTFIHIENFPLLDTEETTITVCAAGDPECCDHYTFPTPICTDECIIYDIGVTVFDCNSDSTFPVVVNFLYQNIMAGGFDIYAGDDYLGFFNVDQIPVELPHFPSNETGNYVITICESDNLECCASLEFEGPVCGGGGNCEIFDLEWALTSCDSAGHFYFILDFDFINVGDAGYNVTGNGNNYGNFPYDSVPVWIGPFPSDDTNFEFAITDANHPDCHAAVNPGIVECIPVSTIPVDVESYFQVMNNGSLPTILAKKDIHLTLYFANGQRAADQKQMTAGHSFDFAALPPGMYFAFVSHGAYTWPVKVVKGGQ